MKINILFNKSLVITKSNSCFIFSYIMLKNNSKEKNYNNRLYLTKNLKRKKITIKFLIVY